MRLWEVRAYKIRKGGIFLKFPRKSVIQWSKWGTRFLQIESSSYRWYIWQIVNAILENNFMIPFDVIGYNDIFNRFQFILLNYNRHHGLRRWVRKWFTAKHEVSLTPILILFYNSILLMGIVFEELGHSVDR